ncbi:unnamed protein product [Alternaria alternata]
MSRYTGIAVTATAKEFAGIYRGSQYHEPDFDAVLDCALAAGVEKVALYRNVIISTHHSISILRAKDQSNAKPLLVCIRTMPSKQMKAERKQSHLLGAFGELGLDYDKLVEAPKDVQIRVFKRQLDMIVSEGAGVTSLPAPSRSVRRFHRDTGALHGPSALAIGFSSLVSVNNFAFRDRDSLEMIRHLPLPNLQIETDAPWGDIQASSEVAKAYLKNASK